MLSGLYEFNGQERELEFPSILKDIVNSFAERTLSF